MMKTVFCLLYIAFTLAAGAQKDIYTVNPGQRLAEAIPDSVQYAYPSFATATLTFKDERSGTARLNYNTLFEEMMFISPAGDTLAIDNGETIKQVVINTDTFYFSNGFVKQADQYGDVKLGSRTTFRIINSRKMGAMGLPTSNTVRSFRAVNTASDLQTLVVQEVLTLEKTTQYYFGDKFNNYHLANRNSLAERVPGKRKLVKDYLKNHNVDFHSKEDIEKMLAYLQQQ